MILYFVLHNSRLCDIIRLSTDYRQVAEYKRSILMASTSITAQYEALPQVAKVLIQIFLGGVIGGIYRVLKYFETKNVVTLVVGIVALVTGIGNGVFWIVDLVTEIMHNKITILAD